MDHRHLTTEAPEHLRKLKSDVASPEHQQVLRYLAQFHNTRIVQIRDTRKPLDWRYVCRQSGINDDQVRYEYSLATLVQSHSQLLRSNEGAFSIDQVNQFCLLQALLTPLAPLFHHATLPFAYRGHIDGYFTDLDAILQRTASPVSNLRAGHQSFGRCTAVVDAGPTHRRPLDHCGPLAFRRQRARQRIPSLSRAENDRVICGY